MSSKKSNVTEMSRIYFGKTSWMELNAMVKNNKYSTVFVLVDDTTKELCLPVFNAKFSSNYICIDMQNGEENKHLYTCLKLWKDLSDLGADRHVLLINLGGGVVTDLGGFVACTYKRGIDFVNIPTTLLSMVDASVGGKTGVDLGVLKNQIGIIQEPNLVVVDTDFLNTLPELEFRSGYAEMLKHGLIGNANYFNILKHYNFEIDNELTKHIQTSIAFKTTVVNKDPHEKGLRKILNFGHTLGHAIESHFLKEVSKKRLLHGEAIAIGMILEAYLSEKYCGLSKAESEKIKHVFICIYGKVLFTEEDKKTIFTLLQHDKKNKNGQIRFVLLSKIGHPQVDQIVSESDIYLSFDFYQS